MGKFFGNVILIALFIVGLIISSDTVQQLRKAIPEEAITKGIAVNVVEGEQEDESIIDIVYSVNGTEYTFTTSTTKDVLVEEEIEVYYKVRSPGMASLEEANMPGVLRWIILIMTILFIPMFITFKFSGIDQVIWDSIFEFIFDIFLS